MFFHTPKMAHAESLLEVCRIEMLGAGVLIRDDLALRQALGLKSNECWCARCWVDLRRYHSSVEQRGRRELPRCHAATRWHLLPGAVDFAAGLGMHRQDGCRLSL